MRWKFIHLFNDRLEIARIERKEGKNKKKKKKKKKEENKEENFKKK